MHMHVAGLSVFDPSTRSDGRLRFEDVAGVMASRLHLAPRFRKRVLRVPLDLALPVWADDPGFHLDFHLRRAALPAPGGRRELADHVQRILSRPLDRTKPLWELYVIEGLEDGHVATLLKVQHAMIDGMSGMTLAAVLYDLSPDAPELVAPAPWTPEPEPTSQELLGDAIALLSAHPVEAFTTALENIRSSPALAALGLGTVLTGVRS